jgi:mono/diheme cytochrome c family protein
MLWLLLAACSGSGSDSKSGDSAPASADPDAPTWYGDVEPIVASRCVGCHTAGEIGGFPLSDYEAVKAIREAVAASVVTRRMPPWKADPGCNDYLGDPSLTDEEIDTIVAWSEAGGPEGDPADHFAVEPWRDEALARVDLELPMPITYTPTAAPDDYRCFLAEWPGDTARYVTGFDIRPGNLEILHHVVLFIVEPGDDAPYRALDEADPAPGYTCYGGPGPDSIESLSNTGWLGSWAPGGGTNVFPEGTGIRMEPGSLVVMQMHYNTATTTGEDLTTIDLQLEDSVEHGAYIQPWTDIAWVMGNGMEIPAGEAGVSHTFEYPISAGDGGFFLHSSALHMHQMGRTARMSIAHADGTETCMASISDWDFAWQRTYWMEEPVQVQQGDVFRLECSWDNTTDQDAQWGEGTGDEMCLGITYLTDVY